MKKSILAIAVAATMAAPAVVMAAPTVYGNVHLSLNAADNDNKDPVTGAGDNNNLTMSSNTSAIGVKGSEDLGDGMKAIYKVEFGIDLLDKPTTAPDTNGAPHEGTGGLTGRDQFVGLKGGLGTIKFGTMSSNYKQMGGKVDPLYRTPLEGRGFLGTQSALHKGRGVNSGRQTSTVQYVSPKMGGISLVANTTFSGAEDETTGLGIRWSNKSILVYADWIDGQTGGGVGNCTVAGVVVCKSEAAYKFGGKFKTKVFSVAGQYEDTEDRTGSITPGITGLGGMKHIFLAGTFNINKNNMIALTYGMTEVKIIGPLPSADYTGVALAYNHKLSKMTNVYVGYGAVDHDVPNSDESMFTAGIRKKF